MVQTQSKLNANKKEKKTLVDEKLIFFFYFTILQNLFFFFLLLNLPDGCVDAGLRNPDDCLRSVINKKN